jgi:hypothetical protein
MNGPKKQKDLNFLHLNRTDFLSKTFGRRSSSAAVERTAIFDHPKRPICKAFDQEGKARTLNETIIRQMKVIMVIGIFMAPRNGLKRNCLDDRPIAVSTSLNEGLTETNLNSGIDRKDFMRNQRQRTRTFCHSNEIGVETKEE